MIELVSADIRDVNLEILQVSWGDPELGLTGEGWSFHTVSSWRVLLADGLLDFGWEAEDAAVRLQSLVGTSIVAVTTQSTRMTGDPAFELSDGRWLEVFACHAVDPWVLHLPPPAIIYIGNPSSHL